MFLRESEISHTKKKKNHQNEKTTKLKTCG